MFKHCNGEPEIITSKSSNNIYRYNLFFESEGALTLRHGNATHVYGNYFIGNNLRRTGGIRVIGEDHEICRNYFHGLAGAGALSALCVMNGVPNSPLHGYYQVKNTKMKLLTNPLRTSLYPEVLCKPLTVPGYLPGSNRYLILTSRSGQRLSTSTSVV